MNLRRFRRPLYKLARRYIRYRDGNPYDFARNGERLLLTRIAAMRPRMVLDVGANVGNWSAAAHEIVPGATLHAFELSSANFDQLASRFSGEDRVHTHPFGLGNRNEEIEYKDYGEGSGHNTILTQSDFHDKRTPPQLRKGKIRRGEDFCAEANIAEIDLLKIDVEGFEDQVLKGMGKLLEEKRVRVVQFEYGYTHADIPFLMRDFYRLFNGLGYQVGRLAPRGVQFQEWSYRLNNFESGPNFVAVPEDREDWIECVRER